MSRPRELLGNEPEAVRLRLQVLPHALGYLTQSAFAEAMGVGISRYNNAILTGILSKELAFRLYQRIPGLRIEWLWFGDRTAMSNHLLNKIDTALAELEMSRKPRGR